MALDYVKVLNAQKKTFSVIGRGEASAAKFKEQTGIAPYVGGINKYLENNTLQPDTKFIIATGTEVLMPVLREVVAAGAGRVLIEKPAAVSIAELLENEQYLKNLADKIFVAYNRRFYSSVIEAQKMIKEDGGLQSMHFEFTEWAHIIGPLEKAPGVKENWFFANSTHVVDLAFYLAGSPTDWRSFSKHGTIDWHEKTNFAGAGITDTGVLFSYISNWESAGRWGIELLTAKRRIYLRPMEGLSVQVKGTVAVNEHEFDNQIDKDFKPGLYKQVEAFLTQPESLLNLSDHIDKSREIYQKML